MVEPCPFKPCIAASKSDNSLWRFIEELDIYCTNLEVQGLMEYYEEKEKSKQCFEKMNLRAFRSKKSLRRQKNKPRK